MKTNILGVLFAKSNACFPVQLKLMLFA